MLVNPLQGLDETSTVLASRVVEQLYQRHPEMYDRFGIMGKSHCLKDNHFHIGYLAESARQNSLSIFYNYATWLKQLLAGYGMGDEHLIENLIVLKDEVALQHHSLAWSEKAVRILDATIAHFPDMANDHQSFIENDNPMALLASAYLQALLEMRRNDAFSMIEKAMDDDGVSLKDIYLFVFQASLREVGQLWLVRKVSVAQEHYVSSATQSMISQLYHRMFATERIGKTFIAACVGDELHEIGLRMVADFLEMDGWDTMFLGANLPTQDIVRAVEESGALVLGLSATIPFHVRTVAEVIKALRENPATKAVYVMVGGYAFAYGGSDWKHIGADAFAEDAPEACRLLAEL